MANEQPEKEPERHRRLRPSGGYRELRSFQTATIIYDGQSFSATTSSTGAVARMIKWVQAARSGRQNIAEGNRAAAASSMSELHLTNVARSSLEEVLLDCQDYLRQHKLPLWDKNSLDASRVRAMGKMIRDLTDRSDRTDLTDPEDAGDRARYALYAPFLEHGDPTVAANTLICLIHQANFLLDQHLATLEQDFIEGGGFTEQLAAARLAHRGNKKKTDPPDRSDHIPKCPQCGKLMALRTARQGKNSGSQFWGCTGYPDCKGTVPIDAPPCNSDPSVRSLRSALSPAQP